MTPGGLELAVARAAVRSALDEDLDADGDITSTVVVPPEAVATARLVARESLVVAGLDIARLTFRELDPSIEFVAHFADGDAVGVGAVLATVEGSARALLAGERTALNFLMRLCGIASATRRAVEEVAGTGVAVLDTRKTAPGLRRLDKYAVAMGGGTNHRLGLYDAAMIKDTHLGALPEGEGIGEAVARLLEAGVAPEKITVEVRSAAELDAAIAAGAGRALLDNMSLEAMRACVDRARGLIVLEASGGLKPGSLRTVAETGVDCFSLGYLTHSARAADVAMEIGPGPSG